MNEEEDWNRLFKEFGDPGKHGPGSWLGLALTIVALWVAVGAIWWLATR